MKVLISGRGPRLEEIAGMFRAKRAEVLIVSDDPALAHRAHRTAADPVTIDLAKIPFPLGDEDLILIAEDQEESLRRTLGVLRPQAPVTQVIVFTPLDVRQLIRDFPGVFFKNDKNVYKNELKDILKRSSTRQRLGRLRKVVEGGDRLLIVMWGNPDPDSIAGAFGLSELVRASAKETVIAYTGEYTRQENLAMVDTLKIPTRPYTPDLVTDRTIVALVDAQPTFFQGARPPRFDIILDHHPLAKFAPPAFEDIRPSYGSTSAMLTEYFVNTGTPMSRRVATALFYGLRIDTAHLTRNVSDADVLAYRTLRPLVDENLLNAIELSQMPLSLLDTFAAALARKKIAQDVIYVHLGLAPHADTGVYIADFFIKISGITCAAVSCRTEEKLVVVFRCIGARKHAGKVAEKAFQAYGAAGGHRTMARAEVPMERLAREIGAVTDAAIERWVIERLAEELRPLAKLLPPPVAARRP